jgi:hypothetical protein
LERTGYALSWQLSLYNSAERKEGGILAELYILAIDSYNVHVHVAWSQGINFTTTQPILAMFTCSNNSLLENTLWTQTLFLFSICSHLNPPHAFPWP